MELLTLLPHQRLVVVQLPVPAAQTSAAAAAAAAVLTDNGNCIVSSPEHKLLYPKFSVLNNNTISTSNCLLLSRIPATTSPASAAATEASAAGGAPYSMTVCSGSSLNARGNPASTSTTPGHSAHRTPIKPAKRHRVADDEREILRCKRSLSFGRQRQQRPRPAPSSDDELAAAGVTEALNSETTAGDCNVVSSASVERRNLRERRRVKQLNATFTTLRQRLPTYCWQLQQMTSAKLTSSSRHSRKQRRRRVTSDSGGGSTRRASKVDTLHAAIDYIRGLQELIADHDAQQLLPAKQLNIRSAASPAMTLSAAYVIAEGKSPSGSVSTAYCSSHGDQEAVFSDVSPRKDSVSNVHPVLFSAASEFRQSPSIQVILDWLM